MNYSDLNPNNASLSKDVVDFIYKIDTLNVDAIFVCRRLRNLKTHSNLLSYKEEYDKTLNALIALRDSLKTHSNHRTASLRAIDKRAEYLCKFLREEYRTATRRVEAEAAKKEASSLKSSSRAAKLIAHFIVQEAAKLNAPFRNSDDLNLQRVSHVKDQAFTDAKKLASLLSEPDDAIKSVDFLEGMDSAL